MMDMRDFFELYGKPGLTKTERANAEQELNDFFSESEDYDESYAEGHEEGHEEGHAEGYDEGHREGHAEGYDEGYKAGKDSVDEEAA